ncbi:MAG: GDSL-type esterase/lipase family protein, partial [Bacillota bacterium]|nr:GDSL-type esterase/lipase family protein [Bacillota bacterium]
NEQNNDAYDSLEIYNASGHTLNLKDYKIGEKVDSGKMDDPLFTGDTVFTNINDITKTSTMWGNTDKEPSEIPMKAGEAWTVWVKYLPSVVNYDVDSFKALNYDNLANVVLYADPNKSVLAEWPADKGPTAAPSDKYDPNRSNFYLTNFGIYGTSDSKRIFLYVLKKTAEIDGSNIQSVVKNPDDIVSYAKYYRTSSVDSGASNLLTYAGDGCMKMSNSNVDNSMGKIYNWQKPVYSFDKEAPQITFNPPAVLSPGSANITASVKDDYDLRVGRVYYKTDSMSDWMSVEDDFTFDDSRDKTAATLTTKIPQVKLDGTSKVEYYIEVSDGGGNKTYAGSRDNPYTAKVSDQVAPVVSDIYPADGKAISGMFTGYVSAKLSDDFGIDPSSGVVTIKQGDTVVLNRQVPAKGVSDIGLWCNINDKYFLPGSYKLTVSVKDKSGNIAENTTSFTFKAPEAGHIYHMSPKVTNLGENTTLSAAIGESADTMTLHYGLAGSGKFDTIDMSAAEKNDGYSVFTADAASDKFASLGRIDYYFTSGDVTSDTYTVSTDGKSFSELLSSDKPLRWLFIGDSITHNFSHTGAMNNYVEMLEQRVKVEMGRSNDVFVNSGVSGQKTNDVLVGIEQQALQFEPDVIFINIGMNDRGAIKPDDIALFKSRLNTIVDKLRNINGKVPKICLLTVVPRGSTYTMDYMANYETVNQIYYTHLDIVREQGLQYVDLFKPFMLERDVDPINNVANFHTDPTHPNRRGHLLMATSIMKGIGIYDPKNSAVCSLNGEDYLNNVDIRPAAKIDYSSDGSVSGTFKKLVGGSIDWGIIGANQMLGMSTYTGGRSLSRQLENGIRNRTSTASVYENRVLNFSTADATPGYFAENLNTLIGPNTPDSSHPIKYYIIMPEVPDVYKDGYQHSADKVAQYKADVTALLSKTKADLNIIVTPPASSDAKINGYLADYVKALHEITLDDSSALIDVYKTMNDNMNNIPWLSRNWFLQDGTINYVAARDIAMMILTSINENGGDILYSDLSTTSFRDTGSGTRYDNIAPSYTTDGLNTVIDVSNILSDKLYSGKDLTFAVSREPAVNTHFNSGDDKQIAYAKANDGKITIREGKAGTYTYRVLVQDKGLTTELKDITVTLSGGTAVTDIAPEHWAYDYAMGLLNVGIISGESADNGISLRPSSNITREETAKILTGVFNLPVVTGEIANGDNSSDWAKDYLATVNAKGIMLGTDGMMNGRNTATRAEVVAMLGRAMGNSDADLSKLEGYADKGSIPDWAKSGAAVLIKAGVIGGYDDGCLHLERSITRAELFAMVSRILASK